MKDVKPVEVVGSIVSPPKRPWDIDFTGDPGLTKQEFARECDVNEILKRCIRFGVPLPGPDAQAAFADVSSVGDFSTAMRRVRAAEEAFDSLPAELRARFRNDPAELVAFVGDDSNRDEAISLGLIPKPVVSEPVVKAPDVPPAKPTA